MFKWHPARHDTRSGIHTEQDSKIRTGITPFEAYHHSKPTLSHTKICGHWDSSRNNIYHIWIPNVSLYFDENTNFLLSGVLLKPSSSFFSRNFKHHPSYGLLKRTPTLSLLPSYNIQSTSIVNIDHFSSVINSCYSDSLAYQLRQRNYLIIIMSSNGIPCHQPVFHVINWYPMAARAPSCILLCLPWRPSSPGI